MKILSIAVAELFWYPRWKAHSARYTIWG